ncbi:hypothetical protein BJX70DRAFT_269618 [Aspergillus crustosus]
MGVSPPPTLKSASMGPLKSRRGCKTCKGRKVKCGEEKPHCLRCTSTGRKCEYVLTTYGTYSSAPATSSTLTTVDNSLSSLPNTVWRERRAFAYYFQHAAPLVGGLDADFWSNIVPQVCRSEPAVWDAIISISALFECHDRSPLNQNYRDALGWYSRAVSAVRQRLQRGGMDVFVGLISCVLFICIEALQGGMQESLRLYGQGVYLILALREQIACGSLPVGDASLLEDTLVPIFTRLGTIANSGGVSIGKLLRGPGHMVAPAFASLKAAREAIILLTAEVQLFQADCEHHHESSFASNPPDELLEKQTILSASLNRWHLAFTNLLTHLQTTTTTTTLSRDQTSTTAILLSHHTTLRILVCISISPIKSTTDLYLAEFQEIVTQSRIALTASSLPDGSQPPFTFDIGVAFPLLVVSLRCADPMTRRAAIALMARAPQVQGFYKKPFAIAFSQRIMEVEESLALSLRMRTTTGQQGVIEPLTPVSMDSSSASSLTRHSQSPGNQIYSYNYNHSPGSTYTMPSPTSPPAPDTMPQQPMPMPLLTGADIPEEARIKPYGVFRVGDGIPPITPVEEVAKWNPGPEQAMLQFSRTVGNPVERTWRVVHECAPIDIEV